MSVTLRFEVDTKIIINSITKTINIITKIININN
jgi:hypothetical protein